MGRKFLVIGSGGREHTITWAISKFKNSDDKIFIIPGNGGTISLGENINIGLNEIVDFVIKQGIYLTVVGPEAPLVDGIVDKFNKRGLKVIGPEKRAALLEGSKEYAKKFMKKYNIPTANFEIFSNYNDSKNYIKNINFPIVIKASGLAAGKGVIIANSQEEAEDTLDNIFNKKKFGEQKSVVIERYLTGRESSIMVFSDGRTYKVMPPVTDFKKVFDGDKGPNTGGMGSICPAPFLDKEHLKRIEENIIKPTFEGLKKENIPYKGILYFGLISGGDNNGGGDSAGDFVLEYNCRFGDPETQSLLPLLKTNIIKIFEAIIDERLADIEIEWENKSGVCVVLTSRGYPEKYDKGFEIKGIESFGEMQDNFLFHAGTIKKDNKIITNGGRVISVVSVKENLNMAIEDVYKKIRLIDFDNIYYRTDIGKKFLS